MLKYDIGHKYKDLEICFIVFFFSRVFWDLGKKEDEGENDKFAIESKLGSF